MCASFMSDYGSTCSLPANTVSVKCQKSLKDIRGCPGGNPA